MKNDALEALQDARDQANMLEEDNIGVGKILRALTLADKEIVRLEKLVAARPEVGALTEEEIAKLEAHLMGPGKYPGFKNQDYCHVCGQNTRLPHQPDCAWAKAKALLSPQKETL